MKYGKLELMILNNKNAVGDKAFSKIHAHLIVSHNFEWDLAYSAGTFYINIHGVLDEDEVRRCIDDVRRSTAVDITAELSGNLSKKI